MESNEYHQKNLEFILSLEEKDLYYWLDTLSERQFEYVEWLIEFIEDKTDKYMMETTEFKEALELLDRFTLEK